MGCGALNAWFIVVAGGLACQRRQIWADAQIGLDNVQLVVFGLGKQAGRADSLIWIQPNLRDYESKPETSIVKIRHAEI